MQRKMARSAKRAGDVVLLIVLGVLAANAANLSALSGKCARQGGDSCSKLERELERCKKTAECIALLSGLPDPILTGISANQGIDQHIRTEADRIQDARKQERAAREQRRSDFQKLRVGMTVAEVEAAIGPINQNLKKVVSSANSGAIEAAAQLGGGGEMHITYTDSGWSQKLGGGNPRNSSFSFEGSEYRLVFDYTGKLKEFQYSGTN